MVVVCDAGKERHSRKQFHASDMVLGHLKEAAGSDTMSAAQRASLGVNGAYFTQQGSMASRS